MLLLKCLLIPHRGVCVTHTQPKHRSPIALAQHTNCSTTTKNDTLPFMLPMVALARKASLAGASRTGAGDGPDASCPLCAPAAEASLKMGGTEPYLLLGATPWRHSQARRGAIGSGRPRTSADERSMAQMLPVIMPPTALPLAAHRVSFLLLPARLELGSRRCSPGLEEDEKTSEL